MAEYHRYRCPCCRETLTENIGFKYPGIRITTRAASWIMCLLRQHSAIKDIHEITRVHWDTIHRIYKGIMDNALEKHRKELKTAGYKPRYITVDELPYIRGIIMRRA